MSGEPSAGREILDSLGARGVNALVGTGEDVLNRAKTVMTKTGGGKVTAGELAAGCYVEPTLFTGARQSMRIAQEEIFGPVLCVLKYQDEDEAVKIANDSIFGLGGGVWSEDLDRARAVAGQMRTGTVWINDWHLLSEQMPFGGYKQSGFGRDRSLHALEKYTQLKTIWINVG